MGIAIDIFYKGLGCRRCRNTGYSGRLGVHELLFINDELRDAVVAGQSVANLRRIAATYGMITLRHDGFRKVREGLVVSDKMEKTVVVSVEDRVKHALYGKVMRRTNKLKAHDEQNQCGVGDRVLIMETRPQSATKRWRVVEVLQKAK